jgi:hypothetical protein
MLQRIRVLSIDYLGTQRRRTHNILTINVFVEINHLITSIWYVLRISDEERVFYLFFLPRCSHTWELAPAFGA